MNTEEVTFYKSITDAFKIIVKMFLIFIFLAFLFEIGLFGVNYRNMKMKIASITNVNDTISSYIQKNGGWKVSSNVSDLEKFKEYLIAFHELEDELQPDYITVVKEKQGSANRATVYKITTKYNIKVPHLINFLSLKNDTKLVRTIKADDNKKPIVTRAYVTEYQNY